MCLSFQYADSPLAVETCFLLLFLWFFFFWFWFCLFAFGVFLGFFFLVLILVFFFSGIKFSLLNMVRCSQRHSGLHPEFIHSFHFFLPPWICGNLTSFLFNVACLKGTHRQMKQVYAMHSIQPDPSV